MRLFAMLLLLIAAPTFPQTAKVFELRPDEAAQAKALYAEKADVEAKIEKLRTQVTREYFKAADSCESFSINGKQFGTCGALFAGSDFEFSEDFRFVVPKALPQQANPRNGIPWPAWGPGWGNYAVPLGSTLANGNGSRPFADSYSYTEPAPDGALPPHE